MMTVTDILHAIADALLMVIVVWYDKRIERLEADRESYEAQLRTLRRNVEACCKLK